MKIIVARPRIVRRVSVCARCALPKIKNMKSVTFTLIDSFNSCDLSHHRSLVSALKAERAHSKRLKKHDAFVTYVIRRSDDRWITRDEMLDAQITAGNF